jgi:hypothetical protein
MAWDWKLWGKPQTWWWPIPDFYRVACVSLGCKYKQVSTRSKDVLAAGYLCQQRMRWQFQTKFQTKTVS